MRNQGDTFVIVVCGLALLATMTFAQAQALVDPTRPPPSVEKPAPVAAPGETAVTGLQTIIRREGAKPAAVINGEYVVLGGRIGENRVIKIGEDSVTLKTPTGRETLKLIPGIEKTVADKTEKIDMKKRGGSRNADAEVKK